MDMNEGIQTLERKDVQRLEKTKLLLALKEDHMVMSTTLKNEQDILAKLTAWIQTTLKPSLVQLRQEMTTGDRGSEERAAAELERAVERLQQQVERGGEEGREREERMEKRREEELRKTMGEEQRERTQAVATLREEITTAAAANFVKLSQNLEANLKGQKEWSEETLRRWTGSHAEHTKKFTEAVENKVRQFMQDFEAKNEEAGARLQAKLKEYLLKEAEREARDRAEWQQKKELWFSSFLKDNELQMESRFKQIEDKNAAAQAEMEERFVKLEQQNAAALEAVKQEYAAKEAAREAAKQERRRRKQEDKEADAKQLEKWQRRLLEELERNEGENKQWREEVGANLNAWEDRYGPFLRVMMENEKQRLMEKEQEIAVHNHPVPQWCKNLLAECNMEKYGPLICAHGFDSYETLIRIDSDDLARMGDHIPLGHRKALLLFLESVREREEKVKQDEAAEKLYQEEKEKQKEKKKEDLNEKLAVIAQAEAQPTPPPVPSRATLTYKENNLRLSRSLLEQMEKNMEEERASIKPAPAAVVAVEAAPVKKVAEKKQEAAPTAASVAASTPPPAAAPAKTTMVGKEPVKAKKEVAKKKPETTSPKKKVAANKTGAKGKGVKRAVKKQGSTERVVPPPPGSKMEERTLYERIDKVKEKKDEESGEGNIFDNVLFIEDVVALIRQHGEKEPKGPRYRVLYQVLQEKNSTGNAEELNKILLSMQKSGLVVFKGQLSADSVLTFVPQ